MRVGLAVVLEVVFAVLAFGVRSLIQLRRTGSTGLVLPRRGAPLAERAVALLFLASIAGLAVAPAVGVAWSTLDAAGYAVAGAVLAGVGIALCVVAQLDMGDSWRIGVDVAARTDLVTGGLFASVRNPIYSAMLVASTGIALLVPNGWSVGALLVLVVALELQVRCVEEPFLRRVHGDAYRAYAATAGRFVPGVGTLGGSR